jgi:ribosomal protein L11 methyltransferase
VTQIRLHVTTSRALAEHIYAALGDAFEDDGFPLALRDIDEARDLHEVALYVEQEEAERVEPQVLGIIRSFDAGLKLETEIVPDIDWVARSLEGLKPVRAGGFFVHGAHDRALRRPGGIAIEIEAGLAFGTGHHGTTAGCLEMIRRVVRREHPQSALDLGTGSAVLAIAIARLARIPVLATDIDPVATRVAEANVRLNGASRFVRAVTATGFHHPGFAANGPFDLIVANILARPLMRLAPDMAGNLVRGGSLILSGILDRQRDAVVAAYAGQRFRHVATLHREGWVTIHLKR